MFSVLCVNAQVRTQEGLIPNGPSDYDSFSTDSMPHQLINDGTKPLANIGMSAEEVDAGDAESVQAWVRRRIPHAYQHCGILDKDECKEIEQWNHYGEFSLDATVRIQAHYRHGRA